MMTQFFSLKKPYLALVSTLLLLTSLFYLAQNLLINIPSSTLILAFTLDFALTIPFIYFLLIRKSKIPKTTIVPIFIIGLIVATYAIPETNQNLLEIIKTWIVPIVEISILTYTFIKIRKLILEFRKTKNDNLDFFDALKQTTTKMSPGILGNLLAMEIAVTYYAFFKWKKTKLKPNQYTYHKDSGTPTLLGALIFLIAIETVSIHFLLIRWSWIAAMIALILSVYSGFQILGFLKSMLHRPYTITNEKLYLKYGILAETTILTNNIKSIELYTKDLEPDSEIKKLSPLGGIEGHNILIEVKEPQTFFGLYGTKKQFRYLALFVDNKIDFLEKIKSLIHE